MNCSPKKPITRSNRSLAIFLILQKKTIVFFFNIDENRKIRMNFVATYDERYDKTPIFGAYGELCRLSVVEVVMGIIGTISGLLYWIGNVFGLDILLFQTQIKVTK